MYYLFDHYHHQIIIILSCFAKNSHWNNELTDLSFFSYSVLETARISGAYEFPGPIDKASTYMALPQKLLSEDKCKYMWIEIQ